MSERQMFGELPPAVEAALRASIERYGVLVPVAVDQDGAVIDGHNRIRISGELGMECPTFTVQVGDDDEAREIALTINADRRTVTPEQRRELVAHLRSEGHSTRAIAGAIGVHHTTVVRDLGSTGANAPVEPPDRIVGLDGKSHPATRPAKPEPELDVPRNDVHRKRHRIDPVRVLETIVTEMETMPVSFSQINDREALLADHPDLFERGLNALPAIRKFFKGA